MQYAFQGEDWIPTNLFGDRTVPIFGAKVDWDEVAFLVIAVAVAIGLRYLLRVTRTGVAMRAVVDNADLAALTGAPPIAIARTSWILGSVLAALAGVLYAADGRSPRRRHPHLLRARPPTAPPSSVACAASR